MNTNVFATKEEIADLLVAYENAINSPAIIFYTGQELKDPMHSVRQKCHALALAHGLKEIPGFYGINFETGEFDSQFV